MLLSDASFGGRLTGRAVNAQVLPVRGRYAVAGRQARGAQPTLPCPTLWQVVPTCAAVCAALRTAAPGSRAGARAPARRAGRAPTARPRCAGVRAGRVGLRRCARRGGLRQPRRGDRARRGHRRCGRPAPGRRCGGPARCQPRPLGRHGRSRCSMCTCMARGCMQPCFTCSLSGSKGVCGSACKTAPRHHCCMCVDAGSPITAATGNVQLLLTAAISQSCGVSASL